MIAILVSLSQLEQCLIKAAKVHDLISADRLPSSEFGTVWAYRQILSLTRCVTGLANRRTELSPEANERFEMLLQDSSLNSNLVACAQAINEAKSKEQLVAVLLDYESCICTALAVLDAVHLPSHTN